MKEFTYVIQDPAGIHARPAGILVKQANTFKSTIRITKADKVGDLKRIFSVMALGAKQGDTVTLHIEGEDEEQAASAIEACLKENF
ncbi:HPr family phosphocarrier protein [Candidatus Avelusimicrobium luingense]|uniref:HPr family phosphocarrier protein n=1 Tax=Candidatus Avelusimicrobium luingense TaxID=3416211 RepID=UPI003D0C0E48